MWRGASLAVVVGLACTAGAPAQSAWRFGWQPGQVLSYRVEQTTKIVEVVEGRTTETSSKLNTLKRWQVLDVDQAGVATVQLTLAALRHEMTTPKGDTLLFDSAKPEDSSPPLREQLGKYVGTPLQVLRVDGRGRVVEVKECKGPVSRLESEPPFALVLPEQGPSDAAPAWDRTYKVTVEPPDGAGEQYEAVQHYQVKAAEGTKATVAVTSTLKALPAALADQVPLLPMQPTGEIVYDAQAGRLVAVRLTTDKELKNYQGEGSSYHFQATYTEQLVPAGSP